MLGLIGEVYGGDSLTSQGISLIVFNISLVIYWMDRWVDLGEGICLILLFICAVGRQYISQRSVDFPLGIKSMF